MVTVKQNNAHMKSRTRNAPPTLNPPKLPALQRSVPLTKGHLVPTGSTPVSLRCTNGTAGNTRINPLKLGPKKGYSLRRNQCRTDAVSEEGTLAEKQAVQKRSRNRGCPTLARRGSSRRDVSEGMSPQPGDVLRSSSQRCSSSRLVLQSDTPD